MPRLEARLLEEDEREPGLLGTAGRPADPPPPAPFVAMAVGNTKEANHARCQLLHDTSGSSERDSRSLFPAKLLKWY